MTTFIHTEESPGIPSKNGKETKNLDSFYSTAGPQQQDPLPIRTGTTTLADTNVSNLEYTSENIFVRLVKQLWNPRATETAKVQYKDYGNNAPQQCKYENTESHNPL